MDMRSAPLDDAEGDVVALPATPGLLDKGGGEEVQVGFGADLLDAPDEALPAQGVVKPVAAEQEGVLLIDGAGGSEEIRVPFALRELFS